MHNPTIKYGLFCKCTHFLSYGNTSATNVIINPLGRPRYGWTYNNEMDLREIGLDGMDLLGLDQDRFQ
jgi:hypothetical protein